MRGDYSPSRVGGVGDDGHGLDCLSFGSCPVSRGSSKGSREFDRSIMRLTKSLDLVRWASVGRGCKTSSHADDLYLNLIFFLLPRTGRAQRLRDFFQPRQAQVLRCLSAFAWPHITKSMTQLSSIVAHSLLQGCYIFKEL